MSLLPPILSQVQLSNHRLHRTVVDRVSDASDKRRIGGQQEVHTDSTPAAKNKKAKGARRSQMPFGYSDIINKPALIGDEWPPAGNWSANNNSLGDWDKCCEAASKVPQHLAEKFAKTSLKMLTAQQPVEKIHPGHGYVRRDEHDRKSAERIGSYDVSASTSPGNDEGVHSDNDHVDVDGTTQTEMEVDEKEDTILPECHPKPVVKIEVKSEVIEDKNEEASLISESAVTPTPAVNPFFPTTLVAPIAVTPQITNVDKMQSPLITDFLKLTQEQFQEVLSEAAKIRKASTDSVGFVRSGTSAFSNIEPKELLIRSPSANNNTLLNNNNNNNNNNEETSVPTISSANTPTTTSASFCRPPGLGPVAHPPTQNGQTPMLVCPICGFMCPSKFHFNSHMNTHGDHQCSMCDYTSRTEGRLKKHMRESHTVEEQLKAGLELEPVKENGTQSTSPKGSVCSKDSNATSPINETFNLSTTMASILDSTTNAIAATSTTEAPSALAALTLDMSSTPNLLSTLAQTNFGASALDQIKAISENPNFMPENGMNLATALGAVSQAIKGEPASPEKSQNGESRRSSSGKLKIFKCKQCGHQSLSKDDQWAHARSHIPAEKQLNCQHCNFVTEYKHHLEYHYRNHIGSKPFQCKKCSYNCVNKSMLNSHMKSHTNHYQFRCMDCTYATKYCHSLKLHLKKYNHRRVPEGMDGNGGDASPPLTSSDATITFSPLTNVKTEIKSEPVEPVTSIASTFPFNPMMANNGFSFANQMLLNKFDSMRNAAQVPSFKCPMCDFVGGTQEEQMRHSMSHILNSTSVPTTIASLYNSLNLPTLESLKPTTAEADESMDCEVKIEDDGSTESHCDEDEEMDQSSDLAVSPTGSSQVSSVDDEQVKKEPIATNGKHSPMSNDSAVERDRESADDAPHSPSDMASVASPPHLPVSIAAPIPMVPKPENFLQAFLNTQAATQFAFNFASQGPFVQCQHCSTPFNNPQLFAAHMNLHTPGNPFKCSKCLLETGNSLNFALHVYQAKHV